MSGFFTWLGSIIKSCFSAVIDFFLALWSQIWGICESVGQYFLDCFNYCWDWVQYGFYSLIDWLLCQLMNFFMMISENFEFEQSFSDADIDLYLSYVYMVDAIFPLGIFFGCCSVYFTLLLTWTIYRFIKSWIPTVSG